MQIIIDIPDKTYEYFAQGLRYADDVESAIIAIVDGTQLLKGHGRLGDLDKIWSELKELEEHYQAEFLKESNVIHESAMCGRLFAFTTSKFIVQDADTIIEADRED